MTSVGGCCDLNLGQEVWPVDNNKEILFCPECNATFSRENMAVAYKEHVEQETEAKRLAVLEDAFKKEFASEISSFNIKNRISRFVILFFAFGFPVLSFFFSRVWGMLPSDSRNYIFLFAGVIVLGIAREVYMYRLAKQKDRLFEEFRKSREV